MQPGAGEDQVIGQLTSGGRGVVGLRLATVHYAGDAIPGYAESSTNQQGKTYADFCSVCGVWEQYACDSG